MTTATGELLDELRKVNLAEHISSVCIEAPTKPDWKEAKTVASKILENFLRRPMSLNYEWFNVLRASQVCKLPGLTRGIYELISGNLKKKDTSYCLPWYIASFRVHDSKRKEMAALFGKKVGLNLEHLDEELVDRYVLLEIMKTLRSLDYHENAKTIFERLKKHADIGCRQQHVLIFSDGLRKNPQGQRERSDLMKSWQALLEFACKDTREHKSILQLKWLDVVIDEVYKFLPPFAVKLFCEASKVKHVKSGLQFYDNNQAKHKMEKRGPGQQEKEVVRVDLHHGGGSKFGGLLKGAAKAAILNALSYCNDRDGMLWIPGGHDESRRVLEPTIKEMLHELGVNPEEMDVFQKGKHAFTITYPAKRRAFMEYRLQLPGVDRRLEVTNYLGDIRRAEEGPMKQQSKAPPIPEEIQRLSVMECVTRAFDFFKKNQYAEAIEQYESARRDHVAETWLLSQIGFCRYRLNAKKDYLNDALKTYQEALELAPEDTPFDRETKAEIYRRMGLVYHKQKKDKEALSVYQKALTLNPKEVEIHLNMGISLLALRPPQLSEAERELQEVISGRHDHYEAYGHLAKVFLKTKELARAREHIDRAISFKRKGAPSSWLSDLKQAIESEQEVPGPAKD